VMSSPMVMHSPSGETPQRNFRQVFMQPWTTTDQRKREVEAMRGAGVVQATRNSWVRRMSATEETFAQQSPSHKPIADLRSEYDTPLLSSEYRSSERLQVQISELAPANMRHSHPDHLVSPGHRDSPTISTPTDGAPKIHDLLPGLQILSPATPHVGAGGPRMILNIEAPSSGGGGAVPPTPKRSAAMFDASLMRLGDAFVPLHAAPKRDEMDMNFSIVAEVGRSTASLNTRDEMEARLAGVSLQVLQKLQQSSSPHTATPRTTQRHGDSTPQAGSSPTIPGAFERATSRPVEDNGTSAAPPLLSGHLYVDQRRIDYAGTRYIRPFEMQQTRARANESGPRANGGGASAMGSYYPLQYAQMQGNGGVATRASMPDIPTANLNLSLNEPRMSDSANRAYVNRSFNEPRTSGMRQIVEAAPLPPHYVSMQNPRNHVHYIDMQPRRPQYVQMSSHGSTHVVGSRGGVGALNSNGPLSNYASPAKSSNYASPAKSYRGATGVPMMSPYAGTQSKSIDGIGIVLVAHAAGQLMVSSIHVHGVAHRHGSVRVGDTLDNVNGRHVQGSSLDEVQTSHGIQRQQYYVTLAVAAQGQLLAQQQHQRQMYSVVMVT